MERTLATVRERLTQLGILLPQVPGALGLYTPALQAGRWIFVSGQLATREGVMMHPGLLGRDVMLDEGRAAAEVAALNALGAVQALRGNLEGLRVVRLTGYVASTSEFEAHPKVVDGASELLKKVFGDELGVGTRLALGVASLPLRSPVEVELLLEVLGDDGGEA